MPEKSIPHPEIAILEQLYIYLVQKTGSQQRADACMRQTMAFLYFDDAEDLSKYERNSESLFTELIDELDRIPAQLKTLHEENEFSEAAAKQLMFSPETLEFIRRERALPKIKDWSKEAPPHPSKAEKQKGPPANADLDDIGPDRMFWQICRQTDIHPLVEFFLPPEVIEEIEIQLNDSGNRVMARLFIAEKVFKVIEDDHLNFWAAEGEEGQDVAADYWIKRYLRCCRLLGGYIKKSESHPGSNPMLNHVGLSDEEKRWLQEKLEAEGLRQLD